MDVPITSIIIENKLQSRQYLKYMVIDLNDVAYWTWEHNIDAHRKVDNGTFNLLSPLVGITRHSP